MDEQPGQESPSYYKQLKYDGLFIDDYYGGRTVVEGQVAVSDDNVVGEDPHHGQGVAANDGNVVGEEEDLQGVAANDGNVVGEEEDLQGVAANDGNAVGEEEDQLQGVVANDGNAVGEEENQLLRVEANSSNEGVAREGMEMFGNYHNLVVERKGHNDKVFKVSLAETVESIKQHIETLLGINVSQQTLFFNGKRLEDSHIIESIRGTAFNPRLELVVEADTASASASASAAQPSSASAPQQTFPAASPASEADDVSGSSPSQLPSSDSDWEPPTSTSSSTEGLPSSEELRSSRNNSARPTRRSERLRRWEGS